MARRLGTAKMEASAPARRRSSTATTPAPAPESFADRLARLRVYADLTRLQLAAKCQPPLDPSTIYRLENGQTPTVATATNLAIALGVSVAELLGQ